jgi:hypothetical protein
MKEKTEKFMEVFLTVRDISMERALGLNLNVLIKITKEILKLEKENKD